MVCQRQSEHKKMSKFRSHFRLQFKLRRRALHGIAPAALLTFSVVDRILTVYVGTRTRPADYTVAACMALSKKEKKKKLINRIFTFPTNCVHALGIS